MLFFFLLFQRVIIIRKPSVIKGRLYSHPKHPGSFESQSSISSLSSLNVPDSCVNFTCLFLQILEKIEPVASKPKHLLSTASCDSDNKNTIARLGFGTGWLFDILTRTEGALAASLQLQPLSMIMGYIADKYGTNENASIITVTHLCVLELVCKERVSIFMLESHS